MTATIAHRGPDGEGYYENGDVALGHRRLSIIDLVTGGQPMFTPEKDVVIVFNGEIYNYRELNRELEKEGVAFRTTSDTETLLHLYRKHGVGMLEKLNGMFAFVIYDIRNDTLFGARDRLGIKPLYYSINDGGFYFASEIKALLKAGAASRRADMTALDHYFTYRYIPGERTAFADVKKLRPACAFTQTGNQPPKIWHYWELKTGGGPTELGETLEEFHSLLLDSVKLQLISDAPLGVFLSGGVDSTTIAGVMSEIGHSPIRTFCIGFGMELDETRDAEITANHYHCEHKSFLLSKNALDQLPKAVESMDEPYGDAIITALYALSHEAVKTVKVALTGEGADEGQMGYIHHEALSRGLSLGGYFPVSLMKIAASLVRRMPVAMLDVAFKYPDSMGPAGRDRLATLLGDLGDAGKSYFDFVSLFTEDEKRGYYGNAMRNAMENGRSERDLISESFAKSGDPLNAYYLHDFQNWLPDNILNKMDKITMSAGLEGRVPFLDHRLVEFLASLPLDLKIRRGEGKFLLRELYTRRYLPPTRELEAKKAFFMPLAGVYKQAFDAFLNHYLAPDRINPEFFNASAIAELRKKAPASKLLYDKQLTALAMFNVWVETLRPEFPNV